MADKKRKYGPICKGMKLTITVEEAIKDALVVILEHGSKSYRGVLLDATKRHLPPGICSAFNDQGGPEKEELGSSQWAGEESCEGEEVEVSASVYRHTYNQSLAQFGTRFQGPPDRNFRKLGGAKPTRNIRLRPRQTLCSKCKATCMQSEKGLIPVGSGSKSADGQTSPLKTRQQIVLPPNPHKFASIKDKKRQHPHFSDNGPKPTKLIKVNNNARLAKTSPFIKISIGETSVVNIPPRIHESDKDGNSSEEKLTDIEDNTVHFESQRFHDNDDNIKEEKKEISYHYRKSLRKAKDSTKIELKRRDSVTSHRKHKKSKHKVKEIVDTDGDSPSSIIITENIDSEDNEDKNENSEPRQIELVRPRLLYTWRQNKGLSPRPDGTSPSPLSPHSSQLEDSNNILATNGKSADSQIGQRKEYKLRSRSRSMDSNPEYEITQDSAYVSYEDPKSVSDRSEGCSTEVDTSSETDSSDYGDGPPGDENMDTLRPLLMKIHTNTVSKCITPDGRKIQTGDIVWGKIKGFPWWPARVLSIAVSQKDNGVVLRQIAHIAWFGSSTMSHIQCSDLYLFLEDFKLRFKRKKRGPYKLAIKQATIAAQSVLTEGNDVECDLS